MAGIIVNLLFARLKAFLVTLLAEIVISLRQLTW